MNSNRHFNKKALLLFFFVFLLPSLGLSQDRIFFQNFEQQVEVKFVGKSSALMIEADEEQIFTVEATNNGVPVAGDFYFSLSDEDEAQIIETGSDWVKLKAHSTFKVGSSAVNVDFISNSAWGNAKGNIVAAELKQQTNVIPEGYLISATHLGNQGSEYFRVVLKRDPLTESISDASTKVLLLLDDISVYGWPSFVSMTEDTIEYRVQLTILNSLFNNLKFEENSQPLKVKTTTNNNETHIEVYGSGHLLTEKKTKGGLVCKTKTGATPNLTITGPSLDFDFSIEPEFRYEITESVPSFARFVIELQGKAGVNSGSVSFNSDLSGGAECMINLGNIDLPKLRFLMFGVGFSGDLSVGLNVDAGFDGPNIELQGPQWNGQIVHKSGIQFTNQQGSGLGNFSRISSTENTSTITTSQSSADFGVSMSGSVSPFVRLVSNINIELGLGGALAYDLVENPLAVSEVGADFNMSFAAPFDAFDPEYTGPKWDLSFFTMTKIDENIDASPLKEFFNNRFGLGASIWFGEEGGRKDYLIDSSPEFTTTSSCFPNNCPAGGADAIVAKLIMNTEDKSLDGLTTFYVKNPVDNAMREVGSNSVSLGESSVEWMPMPSDRGNFAVYSRTSSDLLSQAFPYASTHYSTIPVGEGLYTWKGRMNLTSEVLDSNCDYTAANACSWALFSRDWVDGSNIEFVETELMSNRNFHLRNLTGGNQTRNLCQQFTPSITEGQNFTVQMNYLAAQGPLSPIHKVPSLFPINFLVENKDENSQSGRFEGIVVYDDYPLSDNECNVACKGDWQVSKDYNYNLNENSCDIIARPDERSVIVINPFTR